MRFFDFFGPRKVVSKTQEWEYQGLPVRMVQVPRRKTTTIVLKPHQPITIRGNMALTRTQAQRFLREKWDWVIRQREFLQKAPVPNSFRLFRGEKILHQGILKVVDVQITPLRRPFLHATADRAVLFIPEKIFREFKEFSSEESLKILRQFYLKECERTLRAKVEFWSQQMNLFPKQTRFKMMRSRWGSCNSHGKISLNSRLVAAPDWVVDSVIIHELAHLKFMNHSARFWGLVQQHTSRRHDADQWLRKHAIS